jgi:hypothetical protein
MILLKRIYKQALLILLPLSALSAFIEWKKLPLGILAGGVLGLLNLRGLVRGVEGLIGAYRPTAKIVIFSLLRFTILAAILTILVAFRIANVFGILIGFTVVFLMIIKEGLRVAKEL